jgi:hypothetical protein
VLRKLYFVHRFSYVFRKILCFVHTFIYAPAKITNFVHTLSYVFQKAINFVLILSHARHAHTFSHGLHATVAIGNDHFYTQYRQQIFLRETHCEE